MNDAPARVEAAPAEAPDTSDARKEGKKPARWPYTLATFTALAQLFAALACPVLLLILIFGHTPAPDYRSDLQDLRQDLGQVKNILGNPDPRLESIEAGLDKLVKLTTPPKDGGKEDGDGKEQLERLNDIKNLVKKLEMQHALESTVKPLKGSVIAVEEKLRKVVADLDHLRATGQAEVEPREVLVFTVCSERMMYNAGVRPVLFAFIRRLSRPGDHKLGLWAVVTRKIEDLVPLGEDPARVYPSHLDVDTPSTGVSESPDKEVAEGLAKKAGKTGAATPPRRFVVIATAQCPVPEKDNLDAWMKLPGQLDVLLLGPPLAKLTDKETANGWRDLCARKDGTCRVVRGSNLAEQQKNLARLLWEVAGPVPRVQIPEK